MMKLRATYIGKATEADIEANTIEQAIQKATVTGSILESLLDADTRKVVWTAIKETPDRLTITVAELHGITLEIDPPAPTPKYDEYVRQTAETQALRDAMKFYGVLASKSSDDELDMAVMIFKAEKARR